MRCERIIILGAGRATRMKKSSEQTASHWPDAWRQDALSRPKPMIRVGEEGQPFLQFVLENALGAGFSEATLVVAPSDHVTESFVQEWNERGIGVRMRIALAIQDEPLGTGHAVLVALEQDPLPSQSGFVLCNGDNLPSVRALARLRGVPSGQSLLGYDRMYLGLPPDRVESFAVIEMQEGRLVSIYEKPDASTINRLHLKGPALVSMNLFRFDAEILMPFLLALSPHPERGEKELPSAVQAMIDSGHGLEVLPIAEPILDMTSLADLEHVSHQLADPNDPLTLEVCASSPEDVAIASAHGARRVELCSHWECGGLTPNEVDIRRACEHGIPVYSLIRPRAGHFEYSESEWEGMTHQVEASLNSGASRVVVGALDAQGRFEIEKIRRWTDLFGAHRLVIHRALDASLNWESDVHALRELGVLRLLSSGGEEYAWDGQARIAQLLEWGFDVTVASGVHPDQKATWQRMGVGAVHASCRQKNERTMKYFDGTTHPVSADAVRAWFS
ncbi:MAG: copper homeostasis protein CutC [Flavobacteriales bacterium]